MVRVDQATVKVEKISSSQKRDKSHYKVLFIATDIDIDTQTTLSVIAVSGYQK